jgi:hypothetical protein
VNDFQALLVSKEEIRINTFKELIENKDISILIEEGTYGDTFLKKVNSKSNQILFQK